MEIMVTLIVAGLLGLIPAKIAQSKGYAFGKWWVYGFLLFIVAIIHACVLKPSAGSSKIYGDGNTENIPANDTKKCPYCAETIKAEAKICHFCGRELDAATKNTQADIKNSNSDVKLEGKKSTIKGIAAIVLIVGVMVIGIIMLIAGLGL